MSEHSYPEAPSTVLPKTKAFARRYGADLAIPSCKGSGVGNALVYTRLVEDWARSRGHAATIITEPLAPKVGVVENEDPFTLWMHNPYVKRIINAQDIDPAGFLEVDIERKTLIQVNHLIENICFAYGLRPRNLRPSLYLSTAEMQWAIKETSHLRRPLICLHPGGTTASKPGAPWHDTYWHVLVDCLKDTAGFFQIGRPEFGDRDIGLCNPGRTLRDAMALVWSADIFIGFDSAPMSIATAFEKPVIALFDMRQKFAAELAYRETYVPSVMLRWAYPQNRNIALMDDDDGRAAFSFVIDAIRSHISALACHV